MNKQGQNKPTFLSALKKSSLAFGAMTPLFLGIIGLVGLFQVLLTPKMLASLFRGNWFFDTLTGTMAGSVATGNPVVSYIMGGELLEQGISLFAVSAFILSWISLGFIQLPAEIEIFGRRFTLQRNILTLIFTMLVAMATTLTVQVLA